MASAIGQALARSENLLVEAGTGVGKSLAYLAPLILHSVINGKKVFVATGTKTLQHQLMDKELPFLRKYLPVTFSYALALGADNYLCERRLDAFQPANDQSTLFENLGEIEQIREWSKGCRDGLRSEIDFPLSPQTWYQTCRIPELCSGQDCGKGGDCFYQKARRRMAKADVLIGNHHLLFANLQSDWEYLPGSQILLVDEAHQFDQVASDCLGFEISQRALRRVWEGLRGKDGAGCLLGSLLEIPLEAREAAIRSVQETETKVAETLYWFQQEVLKGLQKVALPKEVAIRGIEHFLDPLSRLVSTLKTLARSIESEEKAVECEGYASRLERLLRDTRQVLEWSENDPWLLWCEEIVPRGPKGPLEVAAQAAFRATPVEPGEILASDLFSHFESNILVSATLSLGGDFAFSRRRLGLPPELAREVFLPSPFDHENQLLLYAPSHLPDPTQFEAFVEAANREIQELVSMATGGAFVLCTSYKTLNALYERFAHNQEVRTFSGLSSTRRSRKRKSELDRPPLVLRQGEAPRERLLEVFKSEGKAVLFAATTFWQGIDVPGQDLELVILTRLPFQVPDDPVLEAKIERCRKRGGNPFYEIQIPSAVTQFRQGMGRLIRSHTDRGIVAVLDTRFVNKPYGKMFLAALPPCRLTDNLSEVKLFLGKGPIQPTSEGPPQTGHDPLLEELLP